jgi:uncharacterized MAPEG superfamily protein
MPAMPDSLPLDLLCLLLLALWSIPLNHAPAIARLLKADVKWALGNRDILPETPPWVGRADRAQRNHHDNLATIATVILLAQLSGQANAMTGLAALIILLARVGHGLFYIAGIGPLRSLCYAIALLGTLAIAWQSLSLML